MKREMLMRKAITSLLVATLALGACSAEPDVTSGTITSKDHDAAKTVCKKAGTGTKKRTS